MKNKTNPYESIGANIRRYRKQNNLSQDALARNAGIPYITLSKIEIGVIKNPSVLITAKIAGALNITLDDLIKKNAKNK